MTALSDIPASLRPVARIARRLTAAARPRRVRTIRQFAEEEIVLPNGPRAGLRFTTAFAPWTGLVLDEYQRPGWRRFWGKGSVQSGKTLMFLGIPFCYHVFELRETVIVGVPTIDLAQEIWSERILPVIESTRYREFLPRRGAGSKGGKFTSIRLGPVWVRFMAPGGKSEISSYTARVVLATEVDKWDVATAKSRETDPVSQLESRTRAYGDRARIYGECTVTTKEGRIYREVEDFGSASRFYIRCPLCRSWITPRREDFRGWQASADVIAARENGRLHCPECHKAWSEADRSTALADPRLVHRGQTVTADGTVTGDRPPTQSLGLSWPALLSPFVTMADVAEQEWRAERSEKDEDLKLVLQYAWAEPYEADILELNRVTPAMVLAKISRHPRGVVPDGCEKLTVFIDMGLYVCWYAAVAWKTDGTGYVIDYGPLSVPQEREAKPAAILTALRSFREDVLGNGYGTSAGPPRRADVVVVDAGAWDKVAYAFIRESGKGYFPAKGFGSGRNQPKWTEQKAKPGDQNRYTGQHWRLVRVPQAGVWLLEHHTDYWKTAVADGWSAPATAPGSLILFEAPPIDHNQFSRQVTAEYEMEEYKPGVGNVRVWVVDRRDNHYGDCLSGCRVAAAMLGISGMAASTGGPVIVMEDAPSAATAAEAKQGSGWVIGRD